VSQANSAKLQREMENIIFQDIDLQNQIKLQLKQNIRMLRAAINMWELNYLFTSPINGRVSFTELWNENQNLSAGSVVVSVVPEDELLVRARIKFPVLNSGKVKEGQRVNIKLENFPHQEFGMLVGKMGKISTVPNGAFYSADVILPDGLVTSYGDRLPMVQQGIGKAEILTEEVSLLMRFFNPIKAVFDEHL
jgi:multidrug resistance efflux pump